MKHEARRRPQCCATQVDYAVTTDPYWILSVAREKTYHLGSTGSRKAMCKIMGITGKTAAVFRTVSTRLSAHLRLGPLLLVKR